MKNICDRGITVVGLSRDVDEGGEVHGMPVVLARCTAVAHADSFRYTVAVSMCVYPRESAALMRAGQEMAGTW